MLKFNVPEGIKEGLHAMVQTQKGAGAWVCFTPQGDDLKIQPCKMAVKNWGKLSAKKKKGEPGLNGWEMEAQIRGPDREQRGS